MFRLTVLSLSLHFLLPQPALAEAAEPDTGALAAALQPVLSQAVETPQQGVPELSLEELGRLVVQAISGRSWGLLAALLVVGVVLVLRKVGSRLLPWFGTARGTAVLAVVGGTSTLMALALSQGQPFSVGLLLSCLMGALSASGLWSVGKSLARPAPAVAPACLPEEVANGTCRPS